MKLHEIVNNREFDINAEYKVYFGTWDNGGKLLWSSTNDGKLTINDAISQYSISYITVDVATREIVIEVLDSACTNVPEVTGLPNIIKAQFISVWDDGIYVFATDCMVDCGSRKVYNIEECTDDNVWNAEHLDREYIRLPNGQEFDVVSEDDMEDDYNGFYYTR